MVVFGQPLRFDRYYDRPKDRFVLRSVTDEIMYEIMMLTGQEYVDEYAAKVKEQMAAERSSGGEDVQPEPVVTVPEDRASAQR